MLKKKNYAVRVEGSQHVIYADDQPLLTPARNRFVMPHESLATAICAEWKAQGTKIKPASMPQTQLAATALDITAVTREKVLTDILTGLDHDLLCHRAVTPVELRQRQDDVWQPYLDWFAKFFGTALNVSTEFLPARQSPEAGAAVSRYLETRDHFLVAGLSVASAVTASLVLALALAEGTKNADEVFAAAELEALYQSERWGKDSMADARHAEILAELRVLEQWFGLLN